MNIAKLVRSIISLAAFMLPLSLLMLSACGGGGGGGGGGAATGGTATNFTAVSTFAGTAYPSPATVFSASSGVVSDGVNLYITDWGSNTIRKMVIATGVASTLAGKVGVSGATDGTGTAATFNRLTGIAIDSTKTNLYVSDTGNNTIRKIVIATGAVTTLAGNPGIGGVADGASSVASFNFPEGITIDSTNTNLYVVDTGNNKIRQVVIATGVVSSVTGAANATVLAGAADGASSSASFRSPAGITTDGTNLYVVDTGNNKIRQVAIATGAVSSLTGLANMAIPPGAMDGLAASAAFATPYGITTDGANLYVADANNQKIRQVVIATGTVSSVTGSPNSPSAPGNTDGAAASAKFVMPAGIFAANGNLYVTNGCCSYNVRQIVLSSAQVSTLAVATGLDGTGAAARFYTPTDVVSDGVNLYVADTNNATIRKVEIATGIVTTLAGQVGVVGAADGTGTAATFNGPSHITTDGASLYVVDTANNKIRKITPASGSLSAMTSANAVVTSLTGAANTAVAPGAADGAASSSSFNHPEGIATDGVNLYVAEYWNHKIRKIVIATGAVSSLTGSANTAVTPGAADGAGLSASFSYPIGITIDSSKANLYVADTGNNKIRKVVIATGVVSSVTGAANTAATAGAADGTGTFATFYWAWGITTDGINLYVTDAANNKIRKVVIATGAVSSLTGAASAAIAAGATDGTTTAATFFHPYGITAVGSALYVTDSDNNTIRKIQ